MLTCFEQEDLFQPSFSKILDSLGSICFPMVLPPTLRPRKQPGCCNHGESDMLAPFLNTLTYDDRFQVSVRDVQRLNMVLRTPEGPAAI